jgi:hypothetical protein
LTFLLLAHLTVGFYWAVEGAGADTQAAQIYVAFIAVLGLLGSAVAHDVAPSSNTAQPARRLASAPGSPDSSLNGDGAEGVAIAAYFLLGGALFSAVGWRRRPIV